MPTIGDSLKKIVHRDYFLESSKKRLARFIERIFKCTKNIDFSVCFYWHADYRRFVKKNSPSWLFFRILQKTAREIYRA